MTRPTPLPWVKSWTSSMTDFDWLALSIDTRGVFGELVKLAGIAWPRGIVKGSDESIAAGLRADVKTVSAAIDRLAAKPHKSVKRLSGGVRIVGWDKYQAPAMALSHAQRGGNMASSHPEIRGRVEGEKTESRHGLLAGYPEWVAQDGDAQEIDRLAAKYPGLDLAEELRDFMSYADRRADEGRAYVDYIAAFRNQLQRHYLNAKTRGWIREAYAFPDLSREPARVG